MPDLEALMAELFQELVDAAALTANWVDSLTDAWASTPRCPTPRGNPSVCKTLPTVIQAERDPCHMPDMLLDGYKSQGYARQGPEPRRPRP